MKIIKKSSAPTYTRDGIKSFLLVSEGTTGAKHITTTLLEMAPSGIQKVHGHATEQCYMLFEGEGVMIAGGEEAEVQAGDTVFIPARAPHGLRNTGKGVLKNISADSPVFGREAEKKLWPQDPE